MMCEGVANPDAADISVYQYNPSFGCGLVPNLVNVQGAGAQQVPTLPPGNTLGIGKDPSVPSLAFIMTQPPGGYDDTGRDGDSKFGDARPVMLQSYRFARHYLNSPLLSITDMPDVHYDDPG